MREEGPRSTLGPTSMIASPSPATSTSSRSEPGGHGNWSRRSLSRRCSGCGSTGVPEVRPDRARRRAARASSHHRASRRRRHLLGPMVRRPARRRPRLPVVLPVPRPRRRPVAVAGVPARPRPRRPEVAHPRPRRPAPTRCSSRPPSRPATGPVRRLPLPAARGTSAGPSGARLRLRPGRPSRSSSWRTAPALARLRL